MNPLKQIVDLNDKVVDLLVENEIEQEVAFATLMSVCLNIMKHNDVNKEDFLNYCDCLYDELVKPNAEPVH
jgi:predicted transcriptional regulator